MKTFASTSLAWCAVALSLSSPAFAAPPANDNLANAQIITGGSGNVTGTNVDATDEVEEPSLNDGRSMSSVWYAWTAPTSDLYQFDTTGSDFDTYLAVFTGTGFDSLTFVTGNDDSGTRTSKVSFATTAGTTYLIVVAGYNDPDNGVETGTIELNWSLKVFDIGQVSIYRGTSTYRSNYEQADDRIPPSPITDSYSESNTYYAVYDHVNETSVVVNYFSYRINGRLFKSYFVSPGSGIFPFHIIPQKQTGTARWVEGSGSVYEYFAPAEPMDSFLGSGSIDSSLSFSSGLATPVALSPTIRINVPRVIKGIYQRNSVGMTSTDYDYDLGEVVNLAFTRRSIQWSSSPWTETLDTANSLKANRDNLVFKGINYPKGSLDNGLALVKKILEAAGFTETGFGSF